MSLKDRVALITGAAQGIGKAIASRLAEDGATVVIADLQAEKAQATASELAEKYKVAALGLGGNVAVSADVEQLINNVLDKFKRLDVLVNNAGITRDGLMVRMSDQDFDDVIAINLKSAFLCTRAAAKVMMKQRSGRIINISSVVGINGNPGQANYSASKAGLIGLTKTVAKELASRNIQVNAVAPGFIRSAMTDKLPEEYRKTVTAQIPLGRFGEPEEVAAVAAFLASDACAYVTGQVLRVDGGIMM